ncbi:MAG: hypothetical protein SFU99_14445 [Saprospiraceae bacterium]|nr:hypothetical protein [Saprospiraceae bacterium]
MKEVNPKKPIVRFESFIEHFPTVQLPVTLNDEVHHEFSNRNEPLPPLMIEQFILPFELEEIDDMTEYIACFKIPETHDFQAIVIWRAGLMDYSYNMMTFTKKGELIDKRAIAGTFYDGQNLTQSVAIIDEDWEILITSGQSTNGKTYDPTTSRVTKLELLPEGQIIDIE